MAKIARTKLASHVAKTLGSEDKNIAKNIAAYLIANGATSEVNSLARDILQIRADDYGTVEATAIVAHKLDEQSCTDIEKMIYRHIPNAKKVIIHERIESDVIGGIRLELANELLDTTVDARLSSLKRKTTL